VGTSYQLTRRDGLKPPPSARLIASELLLQIHRWHPLI
jgi:hypothetical protein